MRLSETQVTRPLPPTQSWICNLKIVSGPLYKVLFVATDQAAYDGLVEFDPKLNVVSELLGQKKDLVYGEHAYRKVPGSRGAGEPGGRAYSSAAHLYSGPQILKLSNHPPHYLRTVRTS